MNNYFDQLVSALDAYPNGMDTSSLHGFLTALAIGPDEAMEQPWPQAIFNIPPETILSEAMDKVEITAMFVFDQVFDELAAECFYPRIKKPDTDNESLKAWCRGFQQAALLAESEWEAFHEKHPDAALITMTIAALIQPEIAEVAFSIPQEKHEVFVAEQAPLLGSAIEAYYQVLMESEAEDIDVPTMEDLPQFSEEELTNKSNNDLLLLLSILDDALPREVIYECMQREASMAEMLNQYLADDLHWDEEQEFGGDSWWTRLHAIMILGGIPGEIASQGLISAFCRMPDKKDDPLWDWLAGYWPALFRNKFETTHQALQAMAEDTKLDWYTRQQATECVLAYAASKGQETLEQALDWLADFIAVEDEDFRYMGGCTLLDFVPERHRLLLEKIADEQGNIGLGAVFVRSDVNQAYSQGKSTPEWERFDNPWELYEPEKILERQQRWHSEVFDDQAYGEDESLDCGENYELDDERRNCHSSAVETYAREQPKVGRNAPCPCGSGKKYKKCHLIGGSLSML
jgi:yecA family protein